MRNDEEDEEDWEEASDDDMDGIHHDQMMETALLGKIANKLTLLHDITMAKQMQDQVLLLFIIIALVGTCIQINNLEHVTLMDGT